MKALTFLEKVRILKYDLIHYSLPAYCNFYNRPFKIEMLTGKNPIFSGWEVYEMLGPDINLKHNNIYYKKYDRVDIYYSTTGAEIPIGRTVNDFITFFHYYGIELNFNEQNETIKKLFL